MTETRIVALTPGAEPRAEEPGAAELAEKAHKLDSAAGPYPWSANAWQTSLAADRVFALYQQQTLLALAVFSSPLFLDAGQVDDDQARAYEAELLNIVLDPAQQGKGLAKQFLGALIEQLQAEACLRLMLEVRESNTAAIKLYHGLNFLEDGRRKNYYPSATGARETAVLMSLSL